MKIRQIGVTTDAFIVKISRLTFPSSKQTFHLLFSTFPSGLFFPLPGNFQLCDQMRNYAWHHITDIDMHSMYKHFKSPDNFHFIGSLLAVCQATQCRCGCSPPADNDAAWFGLGLVGIRLDIPVFAPARQHADVKEARLQYEMSRTVSKQTHLKEALQWSNWYEQYIRCLQSLPKANEAAALATDNYHKTLLQFDNGITGIDKAIDRYKDVLQAQWQAQQILIQLYQTTILLKSETGALPAVSSPSTIMHTDR